MVQLQIEGIDISCHKVELSAHRKKEENYSEWNDNEGKEKFMRHIDKEL